MSSFLHSKALIYDLQKKYPPKQVFFTNGKFKREKDKKILINAKDKKTNKILNKFLQ